MAGTQRLARANRGVVLISILLIVAVLSALVYQMAGRHSLAVAQSQNTFGYDQAYAYALGAETFARQALYEDFSASGQGVDTLQELWARPLAPFEIDDAGFVEIQARDLNGCFNLNALNDTQNTQNLVRFKTLLNNLALPETIADAWRDWVDSDELISGFGAEDGEYLLRTAAHRTPNNLAGHVSELRLLNGMEPEYLALLMEHVCVLPTNALSVNINTATSHVLAAMDPNLSEAALHAVTQSPREYQNVSEGTQDFPELASAVEVLAVTSEYFEIQVYAQVGDSVAVLTSVLHRNPADGAITLIHRDMGKDFRSRVQVEIEEA